jgi:hypothetical protein
VSTIAVYKKKANALINCSDTPTGNVGQNVLITKAYASMYLDNPRVFKWAGMGAFASALVGAGIAGGKSVDAAYDFFFKDDEEVDAKTKRKNLTDLDNMLIAGNKAVYRDIYWQHMAYAELGIEGLLKMLDSHRVTKKEWLIQGWKDIANGHKKYTKELIWRGNGKLLEFEQKVTLQPVYNRYKDLADKLTYVMISPLPEHYAPFVLFYPNGSIANVSERWGWITRHLLPEWKRQDSSSVEVKVRALLMSNTPKGAVCW